ncbi:MAG TPA: hypothetical protein VIH92_03505 [Solirubrobacteraceae bacterium]|jgi:hypothetical protein
MQEPEQLTIKQTATGYWTVTRGNVDLAGAMTRKGAEAERELLSRLRSRSVRRARQRRPGVARSTRS